MKKLWTLSMAAAVACAPIVALAEDQQAQATQTQTSSQTEAQQQAEIQALQKRVAALEKTSIEESRDEGDPEAANRYFGLASGVYNEELYLHEFGLNKDLNLLHQRRFLNEHGYDFSKSPSLLISGYVFARAGTHSDALATDSSQHDEFIEGEMGIDFTGFVNDSWLTYFQIEGYGFGADAGNVVLDQGFTTFGNLDEFPAYITGGYFYPAFGDFTTEFITNTLPRDLGRIRAPAFAVGYDKIIPDQWDINASAFIIDGDAQTSDDFKLNQVGANFQVRKESLGPMNDMALTLGASIVNNMASSLGISGYVEDLPSGTMTHYVPGADVRAKLQKAGFYIMAEYMAAIRDFSSDDFTQTKAGGSADNIRPTAFSSEAGYKFDIWGVPSTFAVTYQTMQDTLAFELPEDMYGALFEIRPFRNTAIALEYLQKNDYNSNLSTSNGETGTGDTDNLVQGELAVFF